MIGAIIQARIQSSRLPGKILKELPFNSGITLIERIIKRLKLVGEIKKIIVATSIHYSNDTLIYYLQGKRISDLNYFRGSEENVLQRFIEAAEEYGVTNILRVTADNPCLDTKLLSKFIQIHIDEGNDYSYSNSLPLGMNFEMVKLDVLKRISNESLSNFDKEHVTFYLKNNPGQFKVRSIFENVHRPEFDSWRMTIDTIEDYAFQNLIFSFFKEKEDNFGVEDLSKLLLENSWISEINNKIKQKNAAMSLEEKRTMAIAVLKLHDLHYFANVLQEFHV